MAQVGYQYSVVNDILNKIKFSTYWNTSKLKFVAKYQPYLEYTDSGIEWLGKIPSHWELSKIKYIAPFEVGWTPPTKYEENFIGQNLWANISDLKDKFTFTTKNKISDRSIQQSGMRIIPKGSLLYSFKLSVGNVSFAGNDLYTNEAIASFLVNSKLPLPYLYYALPIFIVKNASINIYNALILNQELIKNAYILDFSYFEAQKIAQFLDYETAKIDLLIEKQQKLIELLKEKRQAVISHAVTKGLDPNVEMKDSGVEWLGEVPAHWEVKTHKYIFNLNPKKSELSKELMESYCTFLPMEKLKLNSLTIDETRLVKDVYDGYTYFKDGDVLLAKVTPCFENKNMAIAQGLQQGIGFGSSEIYVIRVNSDVNAQYIFYRLQEEIFIQVAISNMTGAGGLKRVPSEFISNYLIALPDIQEQTQIAEYLDTQTSKIDLLIEKAEAQITLMQERRTALISAAVTGKIDLRHWQMPEASDHQGGDNE